MKIVKLKEVCDIHSGATPSRLVEEYWNGDINWITPKDLNKLSTKYINEAPEKITELGYKKCSTSLLPINSLLLSSRAPIGLLAINSVPVCTNQGFKNLVVRKDKLDVLYLFYCLVFYKEKLQSLGSGSTFKEISKKIVEDFEIPIPTLSTQKKIAEILDTADSLRQKDKALIGKYNQLSQSLFLDMFGDPKINNKKFDVKKLSEEINIIGGSQPAKKMFSNKELDGYIRLIQIRDYKSDKFATYIPKVLSKRFCYDDDIMIGRYGPPVFQILRGIEGSYNVALMKAVPSKKMSKEYVYHLLKSKFIQDIIIGNSKRTAGQTGVNLKLLNNLEIIIPPLDLQNKFASLIEQIEKQKQLAEESLKQSETLFQSLVQKAFTGELVKEETEAKTSKRQPSLV